MKGALSVLFPLQVESSYRTLFSMYFPNHRSEDIEDIETSYMGADKL